MNTTASRRRGIISLFSLLALSLLLSACSLLLSPQIVRPNFETRTQSLRAGEYVLDPAHSFLLFKIGHLDLATYVGRFNRFDATLDFDSTSPEQSQLEAKIFLDSLDINDDELEARLAGADWFNSGAFPEATFKTTQIATLQDSEAETDSKKDVVDESGRLSLLLTGELTLRGITREIVLQGRFNGGADNLLTGKYTLGFSATGSFNRTDFGMSEFRGLIGDEVDLEVFAEFQRTK